MVQNQLFSFFIYILVGIFLSFIFDIFRAIRKSIKSSNLATNIEDIFFVIISFIIISTILQMVNQGELRFYIFLGIIFGIIIYFLSISKYIINGETWILKGIINGIKTISNFFIKFTSEIKEIIFKIFGKFRSKKKQK